MFHLALIDDEGSQVHYLKKIITPGPNTDNTTVTANATSAELMYVPVTGADTKAVGVCMLLNEF